MALIHSHRPVCPCIRFIMENRPADQCNSGLRPSTYSITSDEMFGKLEAEAEGAASRINAVRAGTKQAMVIDLLARPTGTSLNDLVDATSWLSHTTRAVLSRQRKKGFEVTSVKPDSGERCYYITEVPQVPAA